MKANLERGEIAIELEGVEHVLRPSFQAQIAIEAATGRSIEQLANAAGSGGLTLNQAAIVVTECVNAQHRAVGNAAVYEAARVGECIVETGKLQITKRLELLLFLAITGGYTASGEVKPLPGTPAAPAAGTAA